MAVKDENLKDLRVKYPGKKRGPESGTGGKVKSLEAGYQEPESLPDVADIVDDTRSLTPKQLRFLEEYAKTFNLSESVKAAGYKASPNKAYKSLLANPWIAEQVKEIEERYRYRWKLSAEMAAAKHVQLMDKFEAAFDSGNDKVAGPLAKMSEASLKATGQLDKDNGPKAASVTVQINIGEDKKDTVIDAEVVDD